MTKKRSKFELFQLEAREVPAVFGQPWVDSATLDVSFAPDGTDVGGVKSKLDSLFGKGTAWENEIMRAMQTWSRVSNINFSLVNDSGTSFSSPRPLQGSSKDGDIRIAAKPLSDNVLAITNPFDLVSNWSGEVILNSNVDFKVGNSNTGTYDLYTVMLQEIGHSLGIGNSTNTNSVMFETYVGTRTDLDASDIAAVQSLYGVRQNDRFEGQNGNQTPVHATTIPYVSNSEDASNNASVSAITNLVTADLTAPGDIDSFSFIAPGNSQKPYLLLRTNGVSFLQAAVSIIDSSTNQIILAESAQRPGQDVELNLKVAGGLVAGRRYFITVEKASSTYSTGRYQLLVGNDVAKLADKLDFNFFNAADRAMPLLTAGSTISTSADLGVARPKGDGRWDYYGKSSFQRSTDVVVYKVTTQAISGSVMVATVWTESNSKAIPRLHVTDGRGNILTGTILRSDDGVHVIQVENVTPSTSYFVHVTQVGKAPKNSEQYWLGIDFRDTAIQMNTLASGMLTASQSTSESVLNITRSQLMKFEISSTGSEHGTRLVVLDSAGKVQFSLEATAAQTTTGSAFLMPGSYTVRISGVAANRTQFTQVYTLVRFQPLTDPIGPEMIDPIGPTSPPTSPPVSPPLVPPPPPPPPSEDPGYNWDPILLVDPLNWWW